MLVGIRVLRPVALRLSVFDAQTKRLFLDRKVKMHRNGTIRLKVPIASDELILEVVDRNLPRAKSAFRVDELKVLLDTKCPIELTQEDRAFIRFAKWFATECSRLQAGEKGTLYTSDGYSILFLDQIMDNGIALSTPARIARSSGIIEVSKRLTTDYTVPMLIVMLLHEYAHKFKNKEYGKKESNELSADLIACHITLNLGFDPFEVEQSFEAMFSRKKTDLNKRRMAAIREFIQIFNKNENKRCKR